MASSDPPAGMEDGLLAFAPSTTRQDSEPAKMEEQPTRLVLSPEQQAEKERLQKINDSVGLEYTKILLASGLDYVRGVAQTLQTLTALLLTSYIALLAGLGKQMGLDLLPLSLYALPTGLLFASLIGGFWAAVRHEGAGFTAGDVISAVAAYETVLRKRRRQLVIPAILAGGAQARVGNARAYCLRKFRRGAAACGCASVARRGPRANRGTEEALDPAITRTRYPWPLDLQSPYSLRVSALGTLVPQRNRTVPPEGA